MTQLSIWLVACFHYEDKPKKKVGIDACIHIVKVEWHFDDVHNRFLASDHPSCRKDHIGRFSFGQGLSLLSLQKIVDNEVCPRIDLVGASIGIFNEGSVCVFEYLLIKSVKIEIMLLPKIVVSCIYFIQVAK